MKIASIKDDKDFIISDDNLSLINVDDCIKIGSNFIVDRGTSILYEVIRFMDKVIEFRPVYNIKINGDTTELRELGDCTADVSLGIIRKARKLLCNLVSG